MMFRTGEILLQKDKHEGVAKNSRKSASFTIRVQNHPPHPKKKKMDKSIQTTALIIIIILMMFPVKISLYVGSQSEWFPAPSALWENSHMGATQ